MSELSAFENIINDKYLIIDDLPDGYIVYHRGLGTSMKLKLLEINDSERKSCLERLNAWASLGVHPNIKRCFNIIEADGKTAVLSEIDLESDLKEWVSEDGPLDHDPSIIAIFIQVLTALRYIHNSEMRYHGNVTLASVTFEYYTVESEEQMLYDAYYAKLANPSYSHNNVSYGSPEQRNNQPLTSASDMYQWAVMTLMAFAPDIRLYNLKNQPASELVFSAFPDIKPEDPFYELLWVIVECLNADPEKRLTASEAIYRITRAYNFSGKEIPSLYIKNSAKYDADALNNLAVACIDNGEPEKALKYWERALSVCKDHPVTLYNLELFNIGHEAAAFGNPDSSVAKKVKELIPDRKSEKYTEIHLSDYKVYDNNGNCISDCNITPSDRIINDINEKVLYIALQSIDLCIVYHKKLQRIIDSGRIADLEDLTAPKINSFQAKYGLYSPAYPVRAVAKSNGIALTDSNGSCYEYFEDLHEPTCLFTMAVSDEEQDFVRPALAAVNNDGNIELRFISDHFGGYLLSAPPEYKKLGEWAEDNSLIKEALDSVNNHQFLRAAKQYNQIIHNPYYCSLPEAHTIQHELFRYYRQNISNRSVFSWEYFNIPADKVYSNYVDNTVLVLKRHPEREGEYSNEILIYDGSDKSFKAHRIEDTESIIMAFFYKGNFFRLVVRKHGEEVLYADFHEDGSYSFTKESMTDGKVDQLKVPEWLNDFCSENGINTENCCITADMSTLYSPMGDRLAVFDIVYQFNEK